MKMICQQHEDTLLDISCDTVGHLCISQWDAQDILKKHGADRLAKYLSIKIMISKHHDIKS